MRNHRISTIPLGPNVRFTASQWIPWRLHNFLRSPRGKVVDFIFSQVRKWQAQQTYSWESPTPNATPDFEIGPDMIRDRSWWAKSPPSRALFPREVGWPWGKRGGTWRIGTQDGRIRGGQKNTVIVISPLRIGLFLFHIRPFRGLINGGDPNKP